MLHLSEKEHYANSVVRKIPNNDFFCCSINTLANDEIQIALLDSYPWSFQGDDGKVIGIYPDLLQEVESNIRSNINFDGKIKLTLSLHPMARIKHDMKASKYVDLIIKSFP